MTQRILLVEDEDPKRRHIQAYLTATVADIDLSLACSVTSAIDVIESNDFALILLDMSLPTFDQTEAEGGGRPQGFGGTEVIRQMEMGSIVRPIIVLTGYDVFPKGGGDQVSLSMLAEELTQEFPDYIRGVLHYNSAVEEWRHQLAELLKNIGMRLL